MTKMRKEVLPKTSDYKILLNPDSDLGEISKKQGVYSYTTDRCPYESLN